MSVELDAVGHPRADDCEQTFVLQVAAALHPATDETALVGNSFNKPNGRFDEYPPSPRSSPADRTPTAPRASSGR